MIPKVPKFATILDFAKCELCGWVESSRPGKETICCHQPMTIFTWKQK